MTAAPNYVLPYIEPDWDSLNRELEIDPVTFEIIRHKLEAINEEQGIALRAIAASPIVTEASDFNIGIYTPDGDIVSMGAEVTLHAGCMSLVIRNVNKDCADNPGIKEGDVFITNDPYKGAVHHPDMSVVSPIFHKGKLVAWSGATAHLVDVGGMTVGSISVKAIEKYQEGLMIPPLKLIDAGVMRQDIWNLIMNATRQPEMVGLDMKGLIAANVVARRRFAELIKKYRIDTVKPVMKEMIRYSERLMREQIRKLPDGEFETQVFLDHDGHKNRVYKTHIRLTKKDSNLIFDFSQSSPQAPGFINCTESALLGGVFGGFAPVLGFGVPWNQGMLNAISIIAPKGLVCNAESPAPTGSATIGEGWMVCNAVVNVLSKLMALHPEFATRSQGVTNGTFAAFIMGDRNQYGEPYGTQLMDAQLGGGGATAIADGMDQAGGFLTTNPNIPNIETNELHGPMLYLFRGFMPDTGGPGTYRGGRSAGVAFTPYDIDRLRCAFTTQGVEVPISTGIFGGTPGQTNRQAVVHQSDIMAQIKAGSVNIIPAAADFPIRTDSVLGRLETIPAKTDEFLLYTGDLWQYTFQGGGGYGDPLLRDPENVLTDVRIGIISNQSARSVYGVVIDNDKLDSDATVKQREALRQQRLSRSELPSVKSNIVPSLVNDGTVTAIGLSLRLRHCDNATIECCCGYIFCHSDENWKDYAASYPYTDQDLPNGIVMHHDLQLVEYLCPECGLLHAVDTELRGEGPVQDFRLFENSGSILNQVST